MRGARNGKRGCGGIATWEYSVRVVGERYGGAGVARRVVSCGRSGKRVGGRLRTESAVWRG